MIVSNEMSRAMGIAKDAGISISQLLDADSPFTELMGAINPGAVALTALTVALAMGISKKYPRSPAIMISVAAATLLQAVAHFPAIDMIGTLPSSLPMPSMPTLPSAADMGGIAAYAGLFVSIPQLYL